MATKKQTPEERVEAVVKELRELQTYLHEQGNSLEAAVSKAIFEFERHTTVL